MQERDQKAWTPEPLADDSFKPDTCVAVKPIFYKIVGSESLPTGHQRFSAKEQSGGLPRGLPADRHATDNDVCLSPTPRH